MYKQRRKAFALPAGKSFSFTGGDSSKNNLELGLGALRTVQERDACVLHDEDNPSKHFDPYQKASLKETLSWEGKRRDSTASMTLPIGPPTRRRRSSIQLANVYSRVHDFLQQDTESHLAVILGSPGVGKTALVVRYVTGRFVHEYDPTLEMTYEKVQEVGNTKGILRVMDTAGSYERCIGYIRQAEGIIVVYSITDRYSFETAKDYLRMIKDYTRLGSPFDYDLPTILVGNKRELRRAREVSREEARQIAKEYGCLFIESSAACDRNVQKIFVNLFLQIHRVKEDRQRAISSNARSFVKSVRNFFHSKKK